MTNLSRRRSDAPGAPPPEGLRRRGQQSAGSGAWRRSSCPQAPESAEKGGRFLAICQTRGTGEPAEGWKGADP